MAKQLDAANRAAGVLRNSGIRDVLVTELSSSDVFVDFKVPATMPWEKQRGVSSSLHVAPDGSAKETTIRFPGADPTEARARTMRVSNQFPEWETEIIPASQGMVHVHILWQPYRKETDPQQLARKILAITSAYYR